MAIASLGGGGKKESKKAVRRYFDKDNNIKYELKAYIMPKKILVLTRSVKSC